MSSELRGILTHSRVYALGTVLNRSAGLVLLPVYTHLLPPEDFGLYSLVMITSELIGIFFGVGLVNAMACLYFDVDDERERQQIVSTAFIGFGGLAFVMSALLYPLAAFSNWVLFAPQDHIALFVIAYAALACSLLFDLGLGYLRLEKRSWEFLWVSLAKTILFLGFNILFVVGLKLGVIGIFYGTLLSSFFLAIGLAARILWQVGVVCSLPLLKKMVKIGLPLAPAGLADAAFQSTDKYFLNHIFAAGAVGQYALGGRVASLLHAFLTAPFAQIWVVRRLETLKQPGQREAFAGILTYFLMLLVTAGLTVVLFAPELFRLVASQDYAPAVAVVPLLVLAFIMLAINMHFEIGLYHAKQTKWLMGVSLLCALINVPVSYLLIVQWGILGAGTAVLLIYTLRTAITGWLSCAVCHVPLEFEWRRVGVILAMAGLCAGVAHLLLGVGISWAAAATKIGLLGLFLGSILVTGIMSADERRTLLALFKQSPRVSVL